MSHPRRGSGPVRQHSLQQLPRRHHQVRRQRSAEEDRSFQIRTMDPIRARRDTDRTSTIERPKVRIAWGNEARNSTEKDQDRRVEVVACQIATGKSKPVPNTRQPRIIAQNSGSEKTCSTLLYSRQELAERLRLAWKQREVNKSNIDVFLAQGTIEERSDSRLSNCSSLDRSPARLSPPTERNIEKPVDRTKTRKNEQVLSYVAAKTMEINESAINSYRSVTNTPENEDSTSQRNLCHSDDVTSKRASFKNGTNAAFLQIVNDPTGELSSTSTTMKEVSQSVSTATTIEKNRRTNSAPPQRRANSVGPSSKTRVSIIIESPTASKPEDETPITSSCSELSNSASRINGIGGRSTKSATVKRRTKNGKKRANSNSGRDQDNGRAKVDNPDCKNMEVVTMVSLVSDADSDSEIEDGSPCDDNLINQLRSNLPTTPIIKNNVTTCCSLNSINRRPIKSVSFQQDSIEVEVPERKTLRIRPQSVQVGRVTGSALPTPEEARTWRTEVTSLTISNISTRQNSESNETTEISLTDREKRCLIVPIGDPRSDKKRKLLRTRSTPPSKVNEIEKHCAVNSNDTGEIGSRIKISGNVEKFQSVHQSSSILLQESVSKLTETSATTKSESQREIDDELVDPAFRTTKEKECWHLYRRMCDKGVCVSFDTVLRGMLTPTEYRLRRKEVA